MDRKIEIPLPNDTGRMDILKIHAGGITKRGEIDYESVAKLADGFNEPGVDDRGQQVVLRVAGAFARGEIGARALQLETGGNRVSASGGVNRLSGTYTMEGSSLTFSPLVPALSRQQMWVSAIQYQAPYGRPDAVGATPSIGARDEDGAAIESPAGFRSLQARASGS